jgi:multicomponent Na+:H+ antiporter subunit D
VYVSFALITVGLLVKAAVVPLHFWTADAYGVAPTPVLILLGGVFSELGLYGFARVFWTVFEPALAAHEAGVRAIFVGIGLLTGLVGGVMALAQHHLKRMLAFVVVSQIGLFLIGIALLSADGLAGTAIFVVGDGLVKAALFACIGALQHRFDAIGERELHGRGRELWPVGIVYGLAALAIADLPPFGAFLGRAMIEDAALKAGSYDWLPPFIALVSALAGAALLRVGIRVFTGLGAVAPEDSRFSESEEEAQDEGSETERRRLSAWQWLPAALLVAAALGWGVIPGVVDAVTLAGAHFVDTAGYQAEVLGGALPPLVVSEAHYPGWTGFLYSMASLLAAAAIAVAGLRPAPRRLLAPVNALRSLHSGHVGDYVAWTAGAAAVLAGLFALVLR